MRQLCLIDEYVNLIVADTVDFLETVLLQLLNLSQEQSLKNVQSFYYYYHYHHYYYY